MPIDRYKVIITPTMYRQMDRIFDYISEELYSESAALKLMDRIRKEILKLRYNPKLCAEIEKNDELDRKYRRLIVRNYIVLYTIDEDTKIVYVSNICHKTKNYF